MRFLNLPKSVSLDLGDYMAKITKATIEAKGIEIAVQTTSGRVDYFSLTDIARFQNPEAPASVINHWMRLHNTIEYLGLWEELHNPDFIFDEFNKFLNESGYNAFTLSPQKWISQTNAVGIVSKSGRYGGTFAHSDIAIKFAA
jgi:hypothetical protein